MNDFLIFYAPILVVIGAIATAFFVALKTNSL